MKSVDQSSLTLLVNGRNLFDPERVKAKGIEYYAIGRGLSVGGVAQ